MLSDNHVGKVLQKFYPELLANETTVSITTVEYKGVINTDHILISDSSYQSNEYLQSVALENDWRGYSLRETYQQHLNVNGRYIVENGDKVISDNSVHAGLVPANLQPFGTWKERKWYAVLGQKANIKDFELELTDKSLNGIRDIMSRMRNLSGNTATIMMPPTGDFGTYRAFSYTFDGIRIDNDTSGTGAVSKLAFRDALLPVAPSYGRDVRRL